MARVELSDHKMDTTQGLDLVVIDEAGAYGDAVRLMAMAKLLMEQRDQARCERDQAYAERDRWVQRVKELEAQLQRVREVVR